MLLRALARGRRGRGARRPRLPRADRRRSTPLKPCYVAAQDDAARVRRRSTAHGFTPLAHVDIYVDDIAAAGRAEPPQADVRRRRSTGSVQAPFVEEGERMFTLRLTEQRQPGQHASRPRRKVTRLSVEQSPARAVDERARALPRPRLHRADAPGLRALRVRGQVAQDGPDRHADAATAGASRSGGSSSRSRRARAWASGRSSSTRSAHYNPKAAVRVPLTIRVRRAIKPERARAR